MSIYHKGLLIILDGVGDRPTAAFAGATPLEAANTPELDRLATAGLCGLIDPLTPGLPVSTHTGTSVLMGLTPKAAYRLPRGPVEAAGIGLCIQPGEVALRCNFATLKANESGLGIVDRRAGRIREGTKELVAELKDIPLGHGIFATLRPATQHRAVLRLSGPDLSAAISDTDPGSGGNESLRVLSSHPLKEDDAAAIKTADALNQFIREAFERLRDHPVNQERQAKGLLVANGIITRGAGMIRNVDSLITYLGLKAAVVTGERTVSGLGRLFDFTVLNDPRFTSLADTDLDAKVAAAQTALDNHDLVFLHIKGTDICAHDRDPLAKKTMLERIDTALAPLLAQDLVIGVSGDHSTACNTGKHTGDPVPSILYAPQGRRDICQSYGETACMQGGLGRISGHTFLLSLLDNMGYLDNYKPTDRTIVGPDRG